jgi:hypothetical protein
MRKFVRRFAGALSIACLVAAIAAASTAAWAQANQASEKQMAQAAPAAQPPGVKQMALSEKQVEGVLAAQKDMDAITEKMPDTTEPDPKVTARLEAAAKNNGFASYEEYNNVVDNIGLVLGGFDPTTRKYVGADVVIKAQIALVEADTKMSDKAKKEALADLNEALKSPAPTIENKGNIDLVAKYYDKLAETLGDDRE